MTVIAGYTLGDRIYDGAKTVVYRGWRDEDHQPIVVKVLKAEFPTLTETTQLKQEYKLLENLNISGIIKPYGLVSYQNSLALILEDIGGNSLKEFFANRQPSLSEFLGIAIQIATTLENLHQLNIIHKDIKPKNIIINPLTGQVKITDFGIASRLSQENPIFSNSNILEGTLAYISPEQTGRMNRAIDYRTDLYSLGVTFYELLAGELPFQATDCLELIHCHIAKYPTTLHILNSEIPQGVSDIVMKLLAKNAEDRYQSAYGLKVDLEQCLQMLQATGEILPFALGQQDLLGKLLIPQKLYGRAAEVEELMKAFERVSQGRSEMLLVSGYSGIGKSSLVNEIHQPILEKKGYFIAGKFDQFQRDIPYASLIQAFQGLIRLLLTENTENLEAWKAKLLTACGENGQLIIDVIPEVELVIGSQPPIPEMGASESQNRFNRVFQAFIRVFAQKEHPLVMFLDDLQWADSASLKLIQTLIGDSNSQYLLLIGAYRDNEVSATHRLMQTLEQIQQSGIAIANLVLSPLKLVDVHQLVADTLKMVEESKPLAEILLQQTQGNPFFLTQLLKSLYQDKLIRFDCNSCRWIWELEEIRAIGVTDNVVDLMSQKIQKLSEATQNILKLAACIGNRFDLETLAIISEKSPLNTAVNLWSALEGGLILPLSNSYKIPLLMGEETAAALSFDNLVNYKFLHDRVQQAAYDLIPESQKKATHLKIGKLLLENQSPEEQKENIFDLVNQLNLGIDLIAIQEKKNQLAELNLIAGRKAKASNAYEPAARYLRIGMELLAPASWQSQYDLTLKLHLAAIEAEYLNGKFSQAETLANISLEQATTLLDQVEVYKKKIELYIAQNERLKAIDIGRQVLEMLGVPLSNLPSDGAWLAELPKLEDLENIPAMKEPDQLAAMNILMLIAPAAYVAQFSTYLQVLLTMVERSLAQGYSGLSAFGFAHYGVILCVVTGKMDAGYQFGQFALKLLEKFQAKELKSKVYLAIYGYIGQWNQHIQETLAGSLEGVQSGLEFGHIEFAGYHAICYCEDILFAGEPLESAGEKLAQYIELMSNFKQDFHTQYLKLWHQFILNLQGLAVDKCRLIGSSYDETVMLPILTSANLHMAISCVYLAKTILFYLFKDAEQSVKNASLALNSIQSVAGALVFAEHNFYYSLALLAQYPNLDVSEQSQSLKQVHQHQETMQQWAFYAPQNFQHKYDLVEAEKARVLGQTLLAMEYYDRAIQGAKKQGYIQEEALANELAAEFYLTLGREKSAKAYMSDAYYGYVSWGALAKVKDLEFRYPQLIVKKSRRSSSLSRTGAGGLTSTSSSSAELLDLETVIKASQAIASEIVLEKLLDKLIKIALENAGAQRGLLLSKQAGEWVIKAAGASESLPLRSSPLNYPRFPQNISPPAPSLLVGAKGLEAGCFEFPMSVINYVQRTLSNVVLSDATASEIYSTDPYIVAHQPKSILCTPILYQGKLRNILYLENNLTADAFTPERIEVLRILSSQAAISLENAELYRNLSVANAQLEDYSHTLEEKVAQRTQQLERANQDLNDFAHIVSHDLKAPLRSIAMLAEWIAADYADRLDEEGQEQLHLMVDQVQRSQALIQGILHYSQMGRSQGEKQAINLNELVTEVIQILSPPTNIEIRIETELPTVMADATRIRQVFQNLLSNAIKYLDKPQGSIKINCVVEANQWKFSVSDNGQGIEEKYFEHIFQLFQTLKPSNQVDSTGVGLSVVKKIVELYGGKVWVESQVGDGSTFFFTLPQSGGRVDDGNHNQSFTD